MKQIHGLPGCAMSRLKAGISQGELAERVGISQSHLSRLEKRRGEASVPLAIEIAKALGCSLDELVSNPVLDDTEEA